VLTRYRVPLLLAFVLLAFALYLYGVPDRPPGFYTDESSIAYNAHTISQTGRDEHGEAFPLFFRAFGEYKNPTYIYLLAALFRLTGPNITAARLLSATLGCAAALLLGLLAARCARRTSVGVAVAASALLTPWLYESSRLVFEVAAYTLALTLFLHALWRAQKRERWSATDVLALAATLALLTYTYSIGRLLGPLLAAGLFIFASRGRLRGVLLTLALYALALVPALVFHLQHPGALTGRFYLLTYATGQGSTTGTFVEFFRRFAVNLSPWRMLFTGELNIRDHMPDVGSLLVPTFVLAVAGLSLILRSYWGDAWWRFVVYALFVSVIPASLTRDEFPQLRLIAVPVFLHLLTVPAWVWLLKGDEARTALRRTCLAVLLIATLAQGMYFQWVFHRGGAERGYVFESHYPSKVLAAALSMNLRPIYLKDAAGHVGYIQAYWYGLLRGVDSTQFVHLPADERAPAGAVVISTEDMCAGCRVITKRINYLVYVVPPSNIEAPAAPLPESAFRAGLAASNIPDALKAGQAKTLRVEIRNTGDATWPAVGQPDGLYRVGLRWRWLKSDGTDTTTGGEARLPFDMDAGEFCAVETEVVAPEAPGEYILELDMAQEPFAWFGAHGSKTLRSAVRVER
jgi:4-amino-4-deoxy-L-arabinose transferase-like glycosyltransferase